MIKLFQSVNSLTDKIYETTVFKTSSNIPQQSLDMENKWDEPMIASHY